MNGHIKATEVEDDKVVARPDLLAHKYRPETVDKIRCHAEQAHRLKQWVLDFINNDHRMGHARNSYNDDDDDDYCSSASETNDAPVEFARRCVLLTGPPGVGKTSLVYTVAKELRMHVVESHPSEKRDFKMFSTLKLGNQKGKINPIARMFQAAKEKQQQPPQNVINSKRKRRKLDELQQSANENSTTQASSQCLSLSGGSSIVLFDDIDVVFEEDGPFLKSLVEFIRESKRPIVLTATQSIDFIREILVHFEHIHLGTPMIDDCTQVLKDICRKEHLKRLARVADCRSIARRMNCDIRQCLNRIQFYGDQAARDSEDDETDVANIVPDLTRLNEFLSCQSAPIPASEDNDSRDSQRTECNQVDQSNDVLECYSSNSLTDLIDSRFRFLDRRTLLTRWLDGQPSTRNEEHNNNHELGKQIRSSIVELTHQLYSNVKISQETLLKREKDIQMIKQAALSMGHTMNVHIKGRIEPPEVDFYTDIVPMLGATIKMEAERRRPNPQAALNGATGSGPSSLGSNLGEQMTISRRTRRVQSYLDSIGIHLEPEEFVSVCETMLNPERLDSVGSD